MRKRVKLSKIATSFNPRLKDRNAILKATEVLQKQMYDLLYLMFAHNKYSLLIILHGIDASGKDGTVRHLFRSANPQGMRVYSFKRPTEIESRHDFLWRCHLHTPESGLTSVFNRSYYEEVTTVKVHPELLEKQKIPSEFKQNKKFFERRYQHINNFEAMLTERGTIVLKFLLHISKDEQKKRLQERLKDRSKNWKFSTDDLKERKYWNDYRKAFEEMVNKTSTKAAPWLVVPADDKWYRNYLVSQAIVEKLQKLKMSFPKLEKS